MAIPELISSGLAGFLAWLFAVAGWYKLRNPGQYHELMMRYLRGVSVSKWLVYPLGALELVVALALLLPATRLPGAAMAAVLLGFYACLMAWQLAQGHRDLRCGCAGPASEVMVSPALVVRNLVCVVAALAVLLPSAPASAGLPGMGLVLFIAVFLTVLYLCSEQMIANRQKMAGSR
ncbi:MAG TPA: MauE/DoxX family redox-associated membrane protein [Kineobactrum sp.]